MVIEKNISDSDFGEISANKQHGATLHHVYPLNRIIGKPLESQECPFTESHFNPTNRHTNSMEMITQPIPKKSRIVLDNKLESSAMNLSIKFLLKVGQCFGFFPLDLDTSPPRFKWTHWRVAYSASTVLLFSLEVILVIHETGRHELKFTSVATFLFQFFALLELILFLKLAHQWPSFVKEWSKVEFNMRKNYEIPCNLRHKMSWIITPLLAFAFVEHFLVNAYKLKNCLDAQANPTEAFRAFFTSSYEHVFGVVGYSFWLGLLVQLLNFQRTFVWSFVDFFIMMVGLALSFRLQQLARRVKLASRSRVKQWRVLRLDYLALVGLCEYLNQHLSTIIIVSFISNSYFVLYQLFNTLRKMESTVQKAYFYISFAFLLVRVLGVCVLGGAVHEEWGNIRFHLGHVGSLAYNEEVERMVHHVTTWELSLSGKNFFFISKELILSMAAAIVTHTLVLIQFYSVDGNQK